MIPAIPLLVVVLVILLIYRGGIRSNQPLWLPGKPILRNDPLRLILFVILIFLLVGFLIDLFEPIRIYNPLP